MIIGPGVNIQSGVNMVTPQDQYFANETLLLSYGPNVAPAGNAQSFTQDASTNNFAVTINGDAKNETFNPFWPDGYWSNYFVASNDRLTLPAAIGNLGSSFCVECFYYPTVASGQIFVGTAGSGAFQLGWRSTTEFGVGATGVAWRLTSTPTVPTLNAWNHIVFVRTGTGTNQASLFINGTRVANGTVTDAWNTNLALSIGSAPDNSAGITGWVSNLRIVNGATLPYDPALTTLTQPTAPLTAITGTSLLTCQSNRFVDNSANASSITVSGTPDVTVTEPFGFRFGTVTATVPNSSAITSGYSSTAFNGSSDYLSWPGTTIGTNAYSIECWFNIANFTTAYAIVGPLASNALNIRINNSTTIAIDMSGVSQQTFTVPTMTANTWYHLAVVRNSSNVTTVFLNGTRSSTGTVTMTNNYSAATGYVGFVGSSYFPGYISNLRIVIGLAVYDPTQTTFTVPTAPLGLTQSAGTNTSAVTTGQTVFLLNGTTYGNNKNYVDSSSNNFTVTVTGNPSQGPISPYYGNNYSVLLNGSTDYFTAPGNAAYAFGTGDFTVEAWVYLTSTTSSRLMTNRTALGSASGSWSLSLGHTSMSFTEVIAGEPGPTASFASILNTWAHVAACRSGTTTRLFVNGVQVGSATQSTNFSIVQTLYIGTSPSESFIGGYVSNARILKGTALYTAAFTPPTAPLTAIANTSLLICQSARFIDNSNYGATISRSGSPRISQYIPFAAPTYSATTYGGSALFNGSTDYLSLPSSANLTLNGDFTVEFWAYATAATASQTIWSPATSDNRSIQVDGTSANWIYFDGTANRSYGAFQANVWIHLALTRSGSTIRGFANGVQGFSITDTGTLEFSSGAIGYRARATAGNYFTGYLSNFRIVKGTAVYTSSFTPPTAPLTAVTNTSLLLNTNSVNTYDLTLSNPVTNVSGASQNTLQPFTLPTTGITYSGISTFGSGYFDGTGDFLQLAANSNFTMTGDFTIEAWVYYMASTVETGIVSAATYTTNSALFGLNSGTIRLVRNNTSAAQVYDGSSITLNTWNHVAVSRVGSTLFLFLNGVATNVGTNSATFDFSLSGTRVGGDWNNRSLTAYLSNVRVVKGTAVYTRSFTPPSFPLSTIPQTSLLTVQQDGPANNNSFIDTGPNNLLVTRSGNTTQGSFTPYWPNGYWSNYFDGNGDYLTVPANTAFAFGTGDFTIECWVYLTAYNGTSGSQIFGGHNFGVGADLIFQINTTGKLNLQISSSGTGAITSTSSVPLNTWTHVAVVRSGGTVTPYINGTNAGGGASYTTSVSSTINPAIGSSTNNNNGAALTGYISNLRVVNGTAVYTSNFTPPTTPLTAIANTSLLTCQSNRFRDNSVNNFTITINGNTSVQRFQPFSPPAAYTPAVYGGSMYFDGTGDYLTSVSSPAFAFGTGDFTIEFWTYPQANSRQDWIYFTGNVGLVIAYFSSGSSFGVFTNPPNSQIITGSSMPLNQWYHVALTRQSNNTRLFVNGVQQGSTYTTSQNYGVNNTLNIGRDPNGSTLMTGYLSDIRVLVGTALYTTTFTPPTSPLQVITNTAFLLPGNGAAIYDRTGTNDLETQGNTQTVTNVRRLGAGCMYFDGTTDFLVAPSSASLSFLATGDFTIEFWAQSTQSVTGVPIVTCASGGGGATATNWGVFTNSAIPRFVVSDGAAYQVLINATSALSSSWSHIAITKSGTTYRLFFNGVLEGSATWAGTPMTTLRPIYVGSNSGTIYYSGYLDNLQITNGVARYTANFTPPVDNPIYR